MSCCTKFASACIFCRGVFFAAVRVATSSLICVEGAMRSLTSVAYHLPMSSHAANPLGTRPPAGKKVTTIWLRTPIRGGMPGSCLTLLTSLTVHLQRLFPDSTDLVSEEFSQEALNYQPGGSCRE